MGRRAAYDREAVLEKAMALFWAQGFHATSLKDLEVALDMRPGSIYAAFGSKEALFREALSLYARISLAALNRALSSAPSPLAGLAGHVRALGRPPQDRPPSRACMLVKTLLEMPDTDPVLHSAAEDLIRQTEIAFRDAFRAAQAAGELSADQDPDRLAARLQAAIFGLRAYSQRSGASDRVAEIAEDIASDLEALRQPAVSGANTP